MEANQSAIKAVLPRLDQIPPEPLHCSAVLTHHWLVRVRGGEKVLQALGELLPNSPIYTLVHDSVGVGPEWMDIKTSFLQHLPGARRHYPKLLPLLPLAARSMRLPPVDLVVCSDAAIAKAMRPDPGSKVVCYCHSPMRYAWEPTISHEYRETLPRPLRPFWGSMMAYLRRVDYRAARRVDLFVANSNHVAERIRRHYDREAVIIHPPVDLPAEPASRPRDSFYLCIGHHVPYKRLDLAIEACHQMGRQLVVIGDGPDIIRFRSQTNSHVKWLGWQPVEVIEEHYNKATALLFPGEEDFGIVPVEAMAHGCPVIAFGVGGATETVIDGQTGVLFAEQTVDALVTAMQRAEGISFDPTAMHIHTQRFSRPRFLLEMQKVLISALEQ